MAGWIRIAEASELEEGSPIARAVQDVEIALYRVGETIFATDNRCTHGHARLCDGYQEGHVIECPLHQGCFDVRSGACVAPPVTDPLRTWPVRIVEDDVEVCLDDEP